MPLASLEPVVTPAPGPSPPHSHHPWTGILLTDECKSAQYTLIDGGQTAYYAPFIGCMNGREGCCPFAPRTATRLVVTPSILPTGAAQVLLPTVYPEPHNKTDSILDACPADYDPISGGCCPKGYDLWTAELGGRTPCISYLPKSTSLLPSLARPQRRDANKPTETLAGVVFAMQFPVQPQDGGLSPGAIAGIVIGCLVGVLSVAAITFLVLLRRRRARRLAELKSELRETFYGADTGTSEVPVEIPRNHTTSLGTRSMARRSEGGDECMYTDPLAKKQELDRPRQLPGHGQLPVQTQSLPRSFLDGFALQQQRTKTPGRDHGYDGNSVRSLTSSVMRDSQTPSELQLARPQRLSRGTARVVYTQRNGSNISINYSEKPQPTVSTRSTS